MCTLHPSLILAPLPAKKQLWEAPDPSSWTLENENGMNGKGFALAKSGELLELGDGPEGCHGVSLRYGYSEGVVEVGREGEGGKRWEEWCSGMDGFGGLVMLAASLVV